MEHREFTSPAQGPTVSDSGKPILLTKNVQRENGVAPEDPENNGKPKTAREGLTLVLSTIAQSSDTNLPEIKEVEPIEGETEGEKVIEGVLLEEAPAEPEVDIDVAEDSEVGVSEPVETDFDEKPAVEVSEPVPMDFDEEPGVEVSEPVETDFDEEPAAKVYERMRSEFDVDIAELPPAPPVIFKKDDGQKDRLAPNSIKGRLKTMQYGSAELKNRVEKAGEQPTQNGSGSKPEVLVTPLAQGQSRIAPQPTPRTMTEQMFQSKKTEDKMTEEQKWFVEKPQPFPKNIEERSGRNISDAILGIQPNPSKTSPAPTPTVTQKMSPEMLKKEIEELEKMVSGIFGVIMKNEKKEREIKEINGGYLLAKVHICHEMEQNVYQTPNSDKEVGQGAKQGKGENSQKWVAEAKQYPDGIYLFLKSPKFGLSVFAGEKAHLANEEMLTIIFDAIQ